MPLFSTPVITNQYSSIEGMNYITHLAAANTIVVCLALPGTATSAASWRLFKNYDDNAGESWIKYAEGTSEYKFIADNWNSYTYSYTT
jgi:hypothetical protein